MYTQFSHRKGYWRWETQIPHLFLNILDMMQYCWEGSSSINQITKRPSINQITNRPSSGGLGHGQLCTGKRTAKLISQQSDRRNLQSVMIWDDVNWQQMLMKCIFPPLTVTYLITSALRLIKVLNLTTNGSFLNTL